jgi:hypothetical protein
MSFRWLKRLTSIKADFQNNWLAGLLDSLQISDQQRGTNGIKRKRKKKRKERKTKEAAYNIPSWEEQRMARSKRQNKITTGFSLEKLLFSARIKRLAD